MARRKFSESEREIMKGIAGSIRKLLTERGWNQKELADKAKMSTSVVSDYLNEKTLATPGSVQMLADAFSVNKGEIDPTFKSKEEIKDDAKMRFFLELERDLGLDLNDPIVQSNLKKAAKIFFSRED